ncbi:DEAD/DEAH box helicase family protein [Halorubrum salinarum]|uniref:DEAD/DEAH box helicase family protein n=1 Tax=Halorubrum salinarum TaxID=2739057 RepID=A0A7D4BR81_9EURY|nr:DEAD/DEAH box helicase family protein [Halorubrum salinarum]QKG93517.1 DEAD/DEAH box helicase family protein [Halorubrum salinarum]
MDPFKNQVDDRTSYTDLDEQFYDARLAKDSLTQGDWPSQIDRAAIDVTYGVALGTTDSAFDQGATIGRMDFGTACGPHYVDGLRALAGTQSDLPQLISEHDASDIGDLAFRLNELRVELTKLGLDDSEIGDLNRATEALIEKLITQHGDETLSRQPLQQPEAVADLLYQLFSDPAVTNYAEILIDSITADTGNSIGGDSLLTHLDRPQMVTPLWDHQRRAITNWVANGTTGYVNMATATGKTVLGLAAIAHLFGDLHPTDTADIPAATRSPTGRATVLIVAGQDLLLEQWQSEFDEHLNIPRSRTETDSDGDRRIELAWGDIEFRTAQELLAADPGLHYDLVILDEAHRYSSGRRDSRGWRDLFDDLTTNADSVLAMSGSIDDEWLGDSGVKDALEANLAQCIEFGITEAREQNVIADFRWDVCYAASNSGDTLSGVADSTTTLTPAYDTDTHKFTPQELTGDVPATVPDTFETLRDLRSFAQSKDGKDARDQSESFDTFATAAFSRRPKRWQLNPPHNTIRQLLTEHVPDRKAVVLVQSYAQADAVSEHLADWFDADTVYTPAKDEAAPYDTIAAFKQADAGVLVGPGDVLGVGVDLPDAGIAVNLAKGGVNASLIQRIGRILRNPTGDKHAHFYHVVTIPGEADARLPGEDGRRLLRRAAEFRALGSRFREHPGFVAVTDTTSHILCELETAGARATIADNRDTSDMVDDDVARTLLDELIDEISLTLDDTRDQPVLTTYWQPESLTPGAMPVHDSVTQPKSTDQSEDTSDTTPTDITVTVTDTNDSPIGNAVVIAETTTDSTESITDADGTVTITPPTSGSDRSLFVSRAGYQNQTSELPSENNTVTITLPDATHTVLTAHADEDSDSDDTETDSEDEHAESVQPDVDELCAEIQRVDGVLAGYPTLEDMDTHSRYAPARYMDVFESWTDALHAADIDPDQRVIDDVQRVADTVDGVPTISDITTHSHYTPATLGEHFGSFDAAIAAAGVHDQDQSSPSSPDTDTDSAKTGSASTTQNTSEPAETTSTSSTVSDTEAPATDTPTETSTRDKLISELQALATDWDNINRKLLYSVGSHHPDEYEEVFGSLDAALVEAGVADPDTVKTVIAAQSTLTDKQNELIGELQDLADEWDTIDRKLLYSVGSHHPDEYDDAFGSVDAALVEAGLADTDATGDDAAVSTDETSTDTTSTATTEKQPQSVDSSTTAEIPSNELAELYVAFDRFQHLLTELADKLDTDGTTPMERWAEAVADHWGEDGPDGAPNYGTQQRDRNDFSINDYRDAHGDGDRVTDFHHVEFAAVNDRIQHLLGDAIEDWDHAVPVTPKSNTPLPVAITSTDALNTAFELLDEFPAYPDADRPTPDDTKMDTDGPILPDGRVDTLTVTVLDRDQNPGSKRDARLQVALTDGTEVPLDIWSTHDLSLDWTVGDTYTIEQARHKSWETSTGTGHELSSTKDFHATPTDTGSAGNTPDINLPSQAGTDTNSTSERSRDASTSGAKSASSSGRSQSSSSGTPSRGDLLDAIQRVGETIDRPLKAGDVSDTTAYSVNDVTRVFGSWQNALDSAGIDNKARLIDDLHRIAHKLGHRPTTTEMNEHGHVSATTYATYFGTYTAAIEQAFDETEATATRSSTEVDTTDRSKSAKTDPETSTATDATVTELDTEGGNQEGASDHDDTVTNSDKGIISDIMNDFDELSDSGSE